MWLAVRPPVGRPARPRHQARGVHPVAGHGMTDPTAGSRILIIDYGSQFTQLIARRVREARVYSEIHPPTVTLDWIRAWKPTGIVLSGGPNSVYDDEAPTAPREILDIAPVLGVCYGMNLIVQLEGGRITPAREREYGRAMLDVEEPSGLFEGFGA